MDKTVDTTSALSQQEAGRVKTELERIHSVNLKYRVLVGYSPRNISEGLASIWSVKISPETIARYAGREQ